MGYSGLIYAAIVAGWAAVLVPRWIRRNEEIERAREADAQRGVRVLERKDGHVRGGRVSPHARTLGVASYQRGTPHRQVAATAVATAASGEAVEGEAPPDLARIEFSQAAGRRRRVLSILALTLAATVVAASVGVIAMPWISAPVLLLATFLVLARRAAIAESRRRSQVERRRIEARPEPVDVPTTRVAVYEPPPPEPAPDPNAWEPVPVPLPTYLTKAKAKTAATRTIDLSSPGAWTSGRLNPASSIALPPSGHSASAEANTSDQGSEIPDYSQRRRAVGD